MIGAVSRQQPADNRGRAEHSDKLGTVAMADSMNYAIDSFVRCILQGTAHREEQFIEHRIPSGRQLYQPRQNNR
jgi:hypothetical protein